MDMISDRDQFIEVFEDLLGALDQQVHFLLILVCIQHTYYIMELGGR